MIALWTVACHVDSRPAGSGWQCDEGQCVCEEGLGDCDGLVETGCETVIRTSQLHCGGCHRLCANGRCVDGRCVCYEDYADCDGDAVNGCESDLLIDAQDCGECGRDCLGGSCRDGACLAKVLYESTSPLSTPAMSSTMACWAEDGNIAWLPAIGEEAQPTYRDDSFPECMAAWRDTLCWIAADQLRCAVLRQGESPRDEWMTGLSGAVGSCRIAVTSSDVFWVHAGSGELHRQATSGGLPTLVATGVDHIAADRSHLYWVGVANDLHRVGADGADEEIRTIDPSRAVLALAAGEESIVYSWEGGAVPWGVQVLGKDGADQGVAWSAGADCRVDVLAASVGGFYAGCTDGRWTGALVQVNMFTGTESVLAADQVGLAAIAVHDNLVYWMTRSQLLRIVQ
ncbi:MAG: hypothetical protein JRI23_27995 [Deltaproteobacteria bacterium]|nr:hypothetical protein [Deltaproteobacteria bacterium]MBW2535934.1 hypothetical protein [Deltaproteobacteria bacterium]